MRNGTARPSRFIEFVVRATPVSQQARRSKNLQAWRDRVSIAARRAMNSGAPWNDHPLLVTIIHFHEETKMDVDNLPKPILDAMKGIAYVDDGQIQELTIRRHSIYDDLGFYTISQMILAELVAGREFVYISIVAGPGGIER
jgi:crossover junction endodeoxyribonuclease RusA